MKRLIFIIPLFFCLFACEMSSREKTISILTWNLYLMFDDEETGDEFYPFVSENGYDRSDYLSRIEKYSDILSSTSFNSDIMVFQEIENEKVLKDLLNAGLGRKGPYYYGLIENNSPITVGYISKYRPIETKIHSSGFSRPILELVFRVGGESFHLFAIHARSQIGGGEEERDEMFSLLDMLLKDRSSRLAFALGDFNEDPDTGMSFVSSDLGRKGVLAVTGNKWNVDFDTYYSPALDYNFDCTGSYWYKTFLSYDHIIFNEMAFDGRGFDFSFAKRLEPPGGKDNEGRPLKYELISGMGVSDHFPIRAVLTYNE